MENLKPAFEIWDCAASCIFSNQSFEKVYLKIPLCIMPLSVSAEVFGNA